MSDIIQKALAFAMHLRCRGFAATILSLAVLFTGFTAISKVNAVSVRDGKQIQTYYTMEESPREILTTYGYETGPADSNAFSGFENRQGEIHITHAFPVAVQCDGEQETVLVTDGNVADVLEKANIVLGEQDLVSTPLNKPVRAGDRIKVTRMETVTQQSEIQLPYETEIVPTSLLAPGKEQVLVEGQDGVAVKVYEQLLVDGKSHKRTLVEEELVQQPVNRRILVGEQAEPVSHLDFGYQMDSNGEPSEYRQVFRGQRAAGYSARVGAKTASGRDAVVGHVAVDPNLIPYGSKLFIQSTDGSFVYGYAIAADTGTAIRDGIIAVDLFYGSYAESALNGIKSVDIFVLE